MTATDETVTRPDGIAWGEGQDKEATGKPAAYYMALKPGLGVGSITIGGLDFPVTVEHVENVQGETVRQTRQGIVRQLYPDQIASFKRALKTAKFRKTAEGGIQVVNTESPHYRPRPRNEADIEPYITFREVEDPNFGEPGSGIDWGVSADEVDDTDPFACPEEGCDFKGTGPRSISSHVRQAHGD